MYLLCFFIQAWSVPEVLRPLYESSKILAQKMTMAVRFSFFLHIACFTLCHLRYSMYSLFCIQALRHIRQIAQETNGEIQCSGGRQPVVLRALSQRLCR